MELRNKRVMIVGLALSGLGAARLCSDQGALVTVTDMKKAEELSDKLEKLPQGVTLILGRKPTLEEAAAQDYLILSPAVPTDADYVQSARKAGARIWSEIELSSYFAKATVIGITGTNGKTTTTSLVEEIAKLYKPQSRAAGNIGFSFTEAALNTPADAYIALELSSFQLESIENFHPHLSAILNFTPDHLNRHHTYEAYKAAKCRIYENQTAGDFCILNYDDEAVRAKGLELSEKDNGPTVVWFSHTHESKGGVWSRDGSIVADLDGKVVEVTRIDDMKIFGPHNEENAMAAAALCLKAGIPLEYVTRGLHEFKGVAHRIEPVGQINGISFYNDSKATNPDAAIKGLLAMKSKQTVLIGGGYDKGTPYDDWCRLFNDRVRRLILVGVTAGDIEACALKYGFPKENIYKAKTFEEAVKVAAQSAQPGDSVLLSPACASWDMFKSYEQRGDIFRGLVADYIKDNQ